MPRIARVIKVGFPHHVTQRGNYNQNVFLDDTDRMRYLVWLQDYGEKFGVSFLAYCLMPNHVHFVLIPKKKNSLGRMFNATQMRYSQYFHRKINARGHLWQGRFNSCVVDIEHVPSVVRYIERNPVRANMVEKPWHWIWSSAAPHSGEQNGNQIPWKDFFDMPCPLWREYVEKNEEIVEDIRKCTLSGRPLGCREFVRRLEEESGRRLYPLPRGRPRRSRIGAVVDSQPGGEKNE